MAISRIRAKFRRQHVEPHCQKPQVGSLRKDHEGGKEQICWAEVCDFVEATRPASGAQYGGCDAKIRHGDDSSNVAEHDG